MIIFLFVCFKGWWEIPLPAKAMDVNFCPDGDWGSAWSTQHFFTGDYESVDCGCKSWQLAWLFILFYFGILLISFFLLAASNNLKMPTQNHNLEQKKL